MAILWWSDVAWSWYLRLPKACLDAGAQKSVIGKRQALAYCKQHNICYTHKPSLSNFKFGDGVFSSLGTLQIKIPNPNYSCLKIKVNLIPAVVPLLLGLDVLDNKKLLANNVQNEVKATNHGRSMPFTRKHGDL